MSASANICRISLLMCALLTLNIQYTDAACSFPENIQNKTWLSSNFQDMIFQNDTVNFTVIFSSYTLRQWSCHVSSGTKYVIQAGSKLKSSSLNLFVYFYYCLDLREQNSDSYLYYLLADAVDNRLETLSNTTTIAEACSAIVDVAQYHVMITKDIQATVKNYCVAPLLGDFNYTCSSPSKANGTLGVCGVNSSQSVLTFNDSCSSDPLYSSKGVLNCIAKTSAMIASDTVYYQTLYNTDKTVASPSYRFVCVAVSKINDTVYMTYNPTNCVAGQTGQTGATAFPHLEASDLCPLDEEKTVSSSDGTNTGLIVGLAVGLTLAVLIVTAVIVIVCWLKRDPNAGKPIVENTKPRFEDPDKEAIVEDIELDASSTPVTRDEITFEAMSPTMLSNGKVQNGHVATSPTGTQGFYPNGVANGSVRRDSGIGTSKSMDRPTPRIGLNPSRESMVIFNGDEKVISGNDTRVVPNTNPNARAFQMDNSMTGGGILSLQGLETEEQDELGELSPRNREEQLYPSLPREKSNLMPPIETIDPEKDKDH